MPLGTGNGTMRMERGRNDGGQDDGDQERDHKHGDQTKGMGQWGWNIG